MDSLKALEVRRVPLSEDLSHPGDFVLIQKREPIRKIERTPIYPPSGFLKRIWWNAFGEKYEVKQVIELLWPDYDTVILNCPTCNQPCATTKNHSIVSLEPLTIETPITCPYCRTNTFKVEEEKIMTA
jgi:hypothetical protein